MIELFFGIEKRMFRTLLHRFIIRQIKADTTSSSMLVDCAIILLDEVRP
jgi:hypothetical protein